MIAVAALLGDYDESGNAVISDSQGRMLGAIGSELRMMKYNGWNSFSIAMAKMKYTSQKTRESHYYILFPSGPRLLPVPPSLISPVSQAQIFCSHGVAFRACSLAISAIGPPNYPLFWTLSADDATLTPPRSQKTGEAGRKT